MPSSSTAITTTTYPPIGAHLARNRASGGYVGAVQAAVALGADCLQVYASPPRQLTFVCDALTAADVDDLKHARTLLDETGVQLFLHTPYTINLCDTTRLLLNARVLRQQVELCNKVGGKGVVVHTGTRKVPHQTDAQAHHVYVQTVQQALKGYTGTARVLIETSAGKGNSIGVSVDDFARLYNAVVAGVGGDKTLGVCVDTCHVYESGYDISRPHVAATYLHALHAQLKGGKRAVKLVHLNDSKKWVGARVDRHEHLGKGGVFQHSYDTLRVLQYIYARVPFVLETHDQPPYTTHYANEIAVFREVATRPRLTPRVDKSTLCELQQVAKAKKPTPTTTTHQKRKTRTTRVKSTTTTPRTAVDIKTNTPPSPRPSPKRTAAHVESGTA